MDTTNWLDSRVLDNTGLTWAASVGLFLLVWALLVAASRLLQYRLQKYAERTESTPLRLASHVVQRTKTWFLLLVAVYVGFRLPALPESAEAVLSRLLILALLVQMGLWTVAGLAKLLGLRREQQFEKDPGAVAAIDVMGFVLRVSVWAIVLLLALDNLGVNITALVAGLGVGGIAVALAVQNILGDLFASLSIVLDKPFAVGDFLIIDDYLGSVEKVGLKTTRMRSLSGEQIIFSNTDLLNSRVRNYGRMFERRVVFSVGVTYQTPPDKLRRMPDIIREAVERQDNVRFDRAHFQKYGDFALVFETVYYVLSPDFNMYMDVQQEINLLIYERFVDEGIEFAYPTQTLFVENAGARSAEAR